MNMHGPDKPGGDPRTGTVPVALVTGGAVRIGAAICRALAACGFGVVIHCSRSTCEAETLALDLRAGGGSAWVVRADLCDATACAGVVDDAIGQASRLDVLVNNAAVFHQDSLLDADAEAFDYELAVNYRAPRLLTRRFTEVAAGGHVINVLDRRVAGVDAACLPYYVSKCMLAAFTTEAARRYGPAFRVNAVAPGAVLAPPGEAPGGIRELALDNPLRLQCTPSDVAVAVVFLVELQAVTGQILYVDCGQRLTIDGRDDTREQGGVV